MGTLIDFKQVRDRLEHKKAMVFDFYMSFFKEINSSGINIPYFIEAKKAYKEQIKNVADLNYYYNKICKYIETI